MAQHLTHGGPFEIIAFQEGEEEMEGVLGKPAQSGVCTLPSWGHKSVPQAYRSPLEPANRLVLQGANWLFT